MMATVQWVAVRIKATLDSRALECLFRAVMAGFAQRLPIGSGPEQRQVATMGADMVHDSGRHVPAGAFAHAAKGIGLQVRAPGRLPIGAVASLRRSAAIAPAVSHAVCLAHATQRAWRAPWLRPLLSATLDAHRIRCRVWGLVLGLPWAHIIGLSDERSAHQW